MKVCDFCELVPWTFMQFENVCGRDTQSREARTSCSDSFRAEGTVVICLLSVVRPSLDTNLGAGTRRPSDHSDSVAVDEIKFQKPRTST